MTIGETRSLALAAVAHGVLLAVLSVGLAKMPPMLPGEPDVIPVDFVEIGPEATVTERPEPTREARPRESEAEPAPDPAPEEPPAPRDEAVQDILAEEVPEPPKPPAKEPPKPKPEPKPEPKKKALDTGALASLIDKALPEEKVVSRETSAFARSVGRASNARVSDRQVATLEQAIRAQIAPCWNPPIGGADVREMTVVLKIELERNGRIAKPPVLIDQTGKKSGNESYARAFAEAAKRAVLRCAPLDLPGDLYDVWRSFELNFDPKLLT